MLTKNLSLDNDEFYVKYDEGSLTVELKKEPLTKKLIPAVTKKRRSKNRTKLRLQIRFLNIPVEDNQL